MDRSATRRGRPSAHAALAAAHERERRLGDADWFGGSAAILAGDLTFVWADELFDSTALPPDAVARARAVFTELRREVIAGQYLDLVLAADDRGRRGRARARSRCSSRPATPSTRPLLLGAALAPGRRRRTGRGRRCSAYGDARRRSPSRCATTSSALFGDPAAHRQERGDDLREGKRTLLVLRALAPGRRRAARLPAARASGDPHLDERPRRRRAATVVAATGALASVEALIAAHARRGRRRHRRPARSSPDRAHASSADLAICTTGA